MQVGDTLYCMADDGVHGYELWKGSSANGVWIGDVDAGTSEVQVKLTGTNGTVTLGDTSGLTFSVGDGTDDATMTFKGTVEEVNEALNGMSFLPTLDYNGTLAKITIATSDLGASGTGGAKTTTDTINITVNPVPDKPVAGDFTATVAEDTVVILSGWNFTDADANAAQSIKVTDLPDHGVLFLDANNNNKFDWGEAVSVNQVISWANAKTTVPRVKYIGEADYNGSDSLRYVVVDSTGLEGTVSGTRDHYGLSRE